jgi:glycosyltransferase involved in cell wall biosynthesis
LGDAGYEYLCPPGSAECLADRILGLIDDDQRRAEMGRANQKRVELCFSIDNMVAAMAELITMASRRLGIQENDVER